MSSGAIMMVGGAGGGANVSVMTVGVTNAKDGYFYGFARDPFAVLSDEGPEVASFLGSLSPDHVTVAGVNYTIHTLRTQNLATSFIFAVADPDENLSATSITAVLTDLGFVRMSNLTFQTVLRGGVNYASWSGTAVAAVSLFGGTDGANVTVTFNV
tara:strand:+ start:190 stop:657 length:468 start_codon:yes stop_codon:yes gene_type:complete